ncbi:MAG TPA: hypothetical protein VF627_11185, partial [Abditibacterium sp.]
MYFFCLRRGALVALLFCAPVARAQDSPGAGASGAAPTAPSTAPSAAPGTAPVPPNPAPNGPAPVVVPSGTGGVVVPAAPTSPTTATVNSTPIPANPSPTRNDGSPDLTLPATPLGNRNGGNLNSGTSADSAAISANAAANAANAAANAANAAARALAPGAATPAPPAAAQPTLPARGTLRIEGTADRLSVFAVGVDAPELLTSIAARANLKLVVDDTISRRITISVKDLPAREIISSIAGAYGLAAADVEGVTL